MAEPMSFDYYYGLESEQFTFIRIPKLLIQDPLFQGLSDRAKILYGIMLDRMSLSRKKGLLDKQNRVYIIFSVENIAEVLNCSRATAGKTLAELDNEHGIGLVERKRRGQGKPDVLYVKNFITYVTNNPNVGKERAWVPEDLEERDAETDEATSWEEEKSQKTNSLTSRNLTSRSLMSKSLTSKSLTPRDAEVGCQEIQELAPNNTDRTNTELSNTENPIISVIVDNLAQPMRRTNELSDMTERYQAIIRENIGYDNLQLCHNEDKRLLFEEIYKIICDVVCIPREMIRINGVNYPYQTVQKQFFRIRQEHVLQIFDQLEHSETKIGNIRKYMLTALYNAPDTYMLSLSQHYRAEEHSSFFG